MRKAFISTLIELAEKDDRVVFLTADLGYSFVEPFARKFPERFFNVGVAEQNMLGIATGLAEAGFIPYVYSIATFASLRPYEFIRNGPVLQKLAIRIIGVGGGFEYDFAGPTHYALEDIGALRLFPGLQIIAPADFMQCRNALLAIHETAEPAYFRLGKSDSFIVSGLEGKFALGQVQTLRQGKHAILIALGPMVAMVLEAAEKLAQEGMECTVLLVASVSPSPQKDLIHFLSQFSLAVTLEAHYVTGGLGSLVCEVVAEQNLNCKVVRCGVEKTPTELQGNQNYMNLAHGLSAEKVIESVKKEFSLVRPTKIDWQPIQVKQQTTIKSSEQ